MAKQQLHWTRRVRSVLASTADIVGDWFYFLYILDLNDDRINEDLFVPVVLGICLVSSVVGLVTIYVTGLGCDRCISADTVCGFTPSKFWSFLELVFEDIPQVAVASYISYELGSFSPQAVFNITTSAMNFVLDFLDLFEPESPSLAENNEPNPDDGANDATVY